MSINRVEQKRIECVGCGNCSIICPVHSIEMKENSEGFIVPFINEEICIHCEKCVSVCQIYNLPLSKVYSSEAYIGITKNRRFYKNAASGGIFGTLAHSFFDKFNNGGVVGAAFIEGKVQHVFVRKREDILSLQNSKYVQSDLNVVFSEIEEELRDGNNVLFSGTPCQVHALNLYLHKEYENLYTIDLICHGVPSAYFLAMNLRRYGDKISNVKFRYKNNFFFSRSRFIMTIYKLNSNRPAKFVLANRDPYYNMFKNNMSFRESCYVCKFANMNRISDITIGDCDSYAKYTSFHTNKATSTIIINSSKGHDLWNRVGEVFDFCPLDLETEAEINTPLKHPAVRPINRDEVVKDFENPNNREMGEKYAKPNNIKGKIVLLKALFLP
jgi:coenzyme F420-reducing hydrogenase beta subunit